MCYFYYLLLFICFYCILRKFMLYNYIVMKNGGKQLHSIKQLLILKATKNGIGEEIKYLYKINRT